MGKEGKMFTITLPYEKRVWRFTKYGHASQEINPYANERDIEFDVLNLSKIGSSWHYRTLLGFASPFAYQNYLEAVKYKYPVFERDGMCLAVKENSQWLSFYLVNEEGYTGYEYEVHYSKEWSAALEEAVRNIRRKRRVDAVRLGRDAQLKEKALNGKWQISRSDSYKVGNCEVGTEAFIKENIKKEAQEQESFSKDDFVNFEEALMNQQFLRVLSSITIRVE